MIESEREIAVALAEAINNRKDAEGDNDDRDRAYWGGVTQGIRDTLYNALDCDAYNRILAEADRLVESDTAAA